MFVSFHYFLLYFLHLVAQSCPTLCDPMAYSPPGSSVLGDSPGKNTGVGCHALLCGSSQAWDQTQISHVAGEFFTVLVTREVHEYWSEYFLSQESNQGFLHCKQILYQLSYQGSLLYSLDLTYLTKDHLSCSTGLYLEIFYTMLR